MFGRSDQPNQSKRQRENEQDAEHQRQKKIRMESTTDNSKSFQPFSPDTLNPTAEALQWLANQHQHFLSPPVVDLNRVHASMYPVILIEPHLMNQPNLEYLLHALSSQSECVHPNYLKPKITHLKSRSGTKAHELAMEAENGNLVAVTEILAKKNSTAQARDVRSYALVLAANGGHTKVVRFLFKEGDLEQKEIDTAILLAFFGNHLDIVKLLLNKENPIAYLFKLFQQNVYWEKVHFMLNHPIFFQEIIRNTNPEILCAEFIKTNQINLLTQVIQIQDIYYRLNTQSLYLFAIICRNDEAINVLFNANPNLFYMQPQFLRKIAEASAIFNHIGHIQSFVERNAIDINTKMSCLLIAMESGHVEIVAILLKDEMVQEKLPNYLSLIADIFFKEKVFSEMQSSSYALIKIKAYSNNYLEGHYILKYTQSRIHSFILEFHKKFDENQTKIFEILLQMPSVDLSIDDNAFVKKAITGITISKPWPFYSGFLSEKQKKLLDMLLNDKRINPRFYNYPGNKKHIYFAIFNNEFNLFRALINDFEDIIPPPENRAQLYQFSINSGFHDIAELILRKNNKLEYEKSIIPALISHPNPNQEVKSILDLLLKVPEKVDDAFEMVLMNPAELRLLLNSPSINFEKVNSCKIIEMAVASRKIDIVKLLLSKEIFFNKKSTKEWVSMLSQHHMYKTSGYFSLMVVENSIGKGLLENAKENRIPILMKVEDKFIVYGDPAGNGIWKETEIKTNEIDLNELPFKQGVIQHFDPAPIPLLSKALEQGHSFNEMKNFLLQLTLWPKVRQLKLAKWGCFFPTISLIDDASNNLSQVLIDQEIKENHSVIKKL